MPESSNAYDQVPYESFPYAQSHPDRLATIATLFGMAPAPLEHCRVLELGCAAGGNLLPIAVRFPESEFIGIDLSPRQVEIGQKIAQMVPLSNARIICGDIAEISKDLGQFDYIVCHGVWSWVPAPVRQNIFELCRHQLRPQGVAFVSYNTYPGWHLRGIVRDMMEFHGRRFGDPIERVAHARGLLDFIARTVPEEKNPYGMLLRQEANLLRSKSDGYLLHEHLEENNHPVYFHEFESQAAASGLQYLGEAELNMMTAESLGAEAGKILGRIATSMVEYEQYLDFLRNRTFRQTLLCHQNIQLDRKIDPARLAHMRVNSSAVADEPYNIRDDKEARFRSSHGSLSTSSPLFKSAMKLLTEVHPATLSFVELVCAARGLAGHDSTDPSSLASDRAALGANLIDCFSRRYVELHVADPGCASRVEERPLADLLVRLQAEHGEVAYSKMHMVVRLSPIERQVAILANGRNTVDKIVADLLDKALHGDMAIDKGTQAAANPADLQAQLQAVVKKTLGHFHRNGLLVPSGESAT